MTRPFHCGTQFGDWESANCFRCKKGTLDDDGAWPACDIQYALIDAYLGDGEIGDEIAKRMTVPDGFPYNWPCGEVEWTEAWKAERRRRQEKEKAQC